MHSNRDYNVVYRWILVLNVRVLVLGNNAALFLDSFFLPNLISLPSASLSSTIAMFASLFFCFVYETPQPKYGTHTHVIFIKRGSYSNLTLKTVFFLLKTVNDEQIGKKIL